MLYVDEQLLKMAQWLLERHPNLRTTPMELGALLTDWIDENFDFQNACPEAIWADVKPKTEGLGCDDLAQYILRMCPLSLDNKTDLAISIQDYKDKIESGDDESE